MGISELASTLASRVDDLVPRLLPAARRSGAYWQIGDVQGNPGKSLVIRHTGPKMGRWQDFATGEHGDLLDLVRITLALDARGAVDWARDHLGLSDRLAPTGWHESKPAATATARRPERDNHLAALGLWTGAQLIAGTVGERYLRARGIAIALPPSLRFAASCLHAPTGQRLPAIFAAVSGADCKITAVQRIYLRGDGTGKAAVVTPKMTLGPMASGAVRLAAASDILGLAEGVETALSVVQLYDVPVWATLGAGRIATVAVPDAVTRLVVFADRGEAGEAAAERARCAHARPGRIAQIVLPAAGGDFNDDLQAELSRRAA